MSRLPVFRDELFDELFLILSLATGTRKNIQSHSFSHILHFKVEAKTTVSKHVFPSCLVLHCLLQEIGEEFSAFLPVLKANLFFCFFLQKQKQRKPTIFDFFFLTRHKISVLATSMSFAAPSFSPPCSHPLFPDTQNAFSQNISLLAKFICAYYSFP